MVRLLVGTFTVGWLVVGHGGLSRVCAEPRMVFQVSLPSSWAGAAFSADGRMLAVTSGPTVKVLGVPEGIELTELPGHQEYAIAVAFSPDGTAFASRDSNWMLRTWRISGDAWELIDEIGPGDEQAAEARLALGEAAAERSIVFSSDSELLAWHENYRDRPPHALLRVWNTRQRREVARISLNEFLGDWGVVDYVGFSSDGRLLKTIAYRQAGNKYVHEARWWEMSTFEPAREPRRFEVGVGERHKGARLSARDVSPDGTVRAELSWDSHFLKITDLTTGKSARYPGFLGTPWMTGARAQWYTEPYIRLSHDKRLLAIQTHYSRSLLLWDVVARRPWAPADHPPGVLAKPVAFSPDGRYLFTVSFTGTRRERAGAFLAPRTGFVWDLQADRAYSQQEKGDRSIFRQPRSRPLRQFLPSPVSAVDMGRSNTQ